MSTVRLGFEVNDLEIILSWGAGFYVEFDPLPGDDAFLAGTAIRLDWHIAVDDAPLFSWPAAVTPTKATISEDIASVHALLISAAKIARLHYDDDASRNFVWGSATNYEVQ